MSEASPSVSAILLCYNCEAFVGEALRSALAQDCDSMEIIVSDDASEDDTFAVVRRVLDDYHGRHRIKISQRSTNSGSKSAHLNHIFPTASGDVLVSFDGDDISEKSRVSRLLAAFRADPRVHAVYSGFSVIDESGRSLGTGRVPHPPSSVDTRSWFARVDAYAAGTTLAIRRAVVDKFAALDPEIHEDIVLPFRASLLGEVEFIDEPLVKARRHAQSLTADLERFESLESYRLRMQRGIERATKNLESRLADIRTAEDLTPSQSRDLGALRGVVFDSVSKARLTGGLMSPSLQVRLRTLLQMVRAGAYREELAQNAFLALMPRAYLRYKRHALGAGRRRTVGRP